jgi:hypothetical protein
VTIGAMKFTKFNGIGLLGEQAVALGDASGGYSVKIHEWPSIPITRLLGLEVEKRGEAMGVNVAELKPVMPYWYDSNMDYRPATTSVGARVTECGTTAMGKRTSRRKSAVSWRPRSCSTIPHSARMRNRSPARSGFSGTSIRVLPLLAKRPSLDAYLRDYLNAPLESQGERFSLGLRTRREEGQRLTST